MTIQCNKEELTLIKQGLKILLDAYKCGPDYGYRWGDEHITPEQKQSRLKRQSTAYKNKAEVLKNLLISMKHLDNSRKEDK